MAKSNLAKFDASKVCEYVESEDQFPVPFDGLWQAVGYSRKDYAVEKLKSHFEENTDFIVLKDKIQKKGRPKEQYFLTLNASTRFSDIVAIQASPDKKEIEIQKRLIASCGGVQDVTTPVGVIDILTDKEVIEVKEYRKWKSAVGQVLMYRNYFKSRKCRIHLFGDAPKNFRLLVEKNCSKVGIKVTWESCFSQDRPEKPSYQDFEDAIRTHATLTRQMDTHPDEAVKLAGVNLLIPVQTRGLIESA